MKKYILTLAICLMGIGSVAAQTEVKDGYVQSEQGFVYKKGSFKINGTKKKCDYAGLYTPDGRICVKISNRTLDKNNVIVDAVAPGTEVIGPEASEGLETPWLYIPTSVKKIYSGGLKVRNVLIYDINEISEHKIEQ